jgi:hypothetical protein
MKSYNLLGPCSRKRVFVYPSCSVIALVFGFWASQYDFRAAVPYVVIVLLLMLQFFRPTILGWLLSLALFGSYTVGIFIKATSREDYIAGVLVGLAPTIALFWARPTPLGGGKNDKF